MKARNSAAENHAAYIRSVQKARKRQEDAELRGRIGRFAYAAITLWIAMWLWVTVLPASPDGGVASPALGWLLAIVTWIGLLWARHRVVQLIHQWRGAP